MSTTETPEEEGSKPPGRGGALAQAALEPTFVIAAFGFALLIVKVTRVSHLNVRTSHGLVEGVGPLSIVLGTVVGHLPAILFIVTLLAVWWGVGSFRAKGAFTSGHAIAAGAVFLGVLLLPWPYLVALSVVGGARWLRSRNAPHLIGTRTRHYYVLVGAVAVLLVVDAEVWLPSETFILQDGTQFVGYELADSAGWVAILTEAERMIVRVPEDDITGREPCRFHEADLELTNFPSVLQVAIGESVALPEPHCGASTLERF